MLLVFGTSQDSVLVFYIVAHKKRRQVFGHILATPTFDKEPKIKSPVLEIGHVGLSVMLQFPVPIVETVFGG
jgi:hypothetical protein